MRVSGVWRAGLVVAVVFAAVWACVIFWWRIGDVTPGATRMLVWLVVVPVAILAVFWIGARIRRRRRASDGAGVPEEAADPDTAVSEDPPVPQWPLAILAAAAKLGCGEGAQALSRHLPELPRPGLHPTLRDRDGLPVLACFDAELETGPVHDRLRPGRGQRPAGEHLRALALLEPVADQEIVSAIGDFSRTIVLFLVTMLCVCTMYFLLIVQMLLVGNLTVMLR